MPELAQVGDGLHQAKRLLHELAVALTAGVPAVTGGATVDRAATMAGRAVLRDMRRGTHGAQVRDEVAGVIGLGRGENAAAIGGTKTPTMIIAGALGKQVTPDRVKIAYDALGATDKVLVDLACSSHNAMWEKNHLLMFQASLDWQHSRFAWTHT